jgi:curli biogenesis system outer membrane secretion channel CsgG
MANKLILAIITTVFLVTLSACGTNAMVVETGGPTIQEAQVAPANGEKPRIAVMDFENKTRYYVGRGMRSMLTSSLFRSNRFIVLERDQLDDVLTEQRLSATGVVDADTSVPMGELEGAEYLIIGAVTEFEPAQRGGSAGLSTVQQSHVALDIRIVDARTSRTLFATTVVGHANDFSLNSAGLIDKDVLQYAGQSPMLFLEIWNNTPVENAIRVCIEEAVKYIVTKLQP